MRIATFLLLVIWGTTTAQEYTYQYGQILEDFRGGLGTVTVTWKFSDKEFSATITSATELLSPFTNVRVENLNAAYGKLLIEIGSEDNPNIKSNKIEFLDYIGSLGWEFIYIQEFSSRTLYYFKKAIREEVSSQHNN